MGVVGTYFMCLTNAHVHNEKLYASIKLDTNATQVAHKSMMSKKKKKLRAICYNLTSTLARPSHD